MIRRIVGRCHVGDSDEKVCLYVISRLAPGAWEKLPTQAPEGVTSKAALCHLAIDAHRENFILYAAVMSGKV